MERISEFRTGMNTHTRSASAVATLDAPAALPELAGHRLALRELRASDAPALFSLLAAHEVARFISEPPSSNQTRTFWRRTSSSTTLPVPPGVLTRLPTFGRPLRISL